MTDLFLDYMKRRDYYNSRRFMMERIAGNNYEKARKNPRFVELNNRKSFLTMKAGIAEYRGKNKEAMTLQDEIKQCQKEIESVLNVMGFTELDFIPKIVCQNCFDTGHTKDGKLCGCYPGK